VRVHWLQVGWNDEDKYWLISCYSCHNLFGSGTFKVRGCGKLHSSLTEMPAMLHQQISCALKLTLLPGPYALECFAVRIRRGCRRGGTHSPMGQPVVAT